MKRPPIKNPITAIRLGNCKSERPEIACPEVQPPAYLAPKPTIKPPNTRIMIPFRLVNTFNPKSSSGCMPVGAFKPNAERSLIVLAEICTPWVVLRKLWAINPPIMVPSIKTKFHCCDFQLKSKNLIHFPAPAMEQTVLRFEENPNDCPKKRRMNITVAMTMPEVHHGQGCDKNSIILFELK